MLYSSRWLPFLLPSVLSSVFSVAAIAWIAVRARSSSARSVAMAVLAGQVLVTLASSAVIVAVVESGTRPLMLSAINGVGFLLHGALVLVGGWAFAEASWGAERDPANR